jgi:hypothetical protein
MRKIWLRIPLFFGIIFIFFISCERIDEPKQAQLSDFAKRYIAMRLGSQNSLQESRNSAVNNSFQVLFGAQLANPGGRLSGVKDSVITTPPDTSIVVDPWNPDTSKTQPPDSTGWIDPSNPGDTVNYGTTDSVIYKDPWISCGIITQSNNPDGSTTIINDYGSGCEEGWDYYKYFVYGKITSTFLSSNLSNENKLTNAYSYRTVYDHYGIRFYSDSSQSETNGISEYAGNSEYDSLSLNFSGWYTYSDNTTYIYNATTYHYISSGKTTYDNQKSTTEYANYEYDFGDDFYRTTVLEPLVMNYSCWYNTVKNEANSADGINQCFGPAIQYTSGREKVEFKQGSESGELIIDYGNGECDNIITIIENGVEVTVDLGQQWAGIASASSANSSGK